MTGAEKRGRGNSERSSRDRRRRIFYVNEIHLRAGQPMSTHAFRIIANPGPYCRARKRTRGVSEGVYNGLRRSRCSGLQITLTPAGSTILPIPLTDPNLLISSFHCSVLARGICAPPASSTTKVREPTFLSAGLPVMLAAGATIVDVKRLGTSRLVIFEIAEDSWHVPYGTDSLGMHTQSYCRSSHRNLVLGCSDT